MVTGKTDSCIPVTGRDKQELGVILGSVEFKGSLGYGSTYLSKKKEEKEDQLRVFDVGS